MSRDVYSADKELNALVTLLRTALPGLVQLVVSHELEYVDVEGLKWALQRILHNVPLLASVPELKKIFVLAPPHTGVKIEHAFQRGEDVIVCAEVFVHCAGSPSTLVKLAIYKFYEPTTADVLFSLDLLRKRFRTLVVGYDVERCCFVEKSYIGDRELLAEVERFLLDVVIPLVRKVYFG